MITINCTKICNSLKEKYTKERENTTNIPSNSGSQDFNKKTNISRIFISSEWQDVLTMPTEFSQEEEEYDEIFENKAAIL
ncbi:hypothetical protein ABEB36_000334 [Hypothenemus hampei]|uniref:Uncharacterized protein n=1 Tax=Hypothenemus hampei TaxID=57062 RepID=A0ABD1FE19_HYPHA